MKGFIVVDNFYQDPDGIRSQALAASFSKKHPKYPGLDSAVTFNYEEAVKKIHEHVQYETAPAKFSGFFRLSLEDKNYTEGHGVHVDNYDIAVIIYLTKVRNAPGTQFVRHKPSGLTDFYRIKKSTHLNPGWQQYESAEIIKKIVNDMEKNDHSLWEKYDEVEYCFNRALIMRGNMFHRLAQGFGQNLQDGRLTHNFFLNLKK